MNFLRTVLIEPFVLLTDLLLAAEDTSGGDTTVIINFLRGFLYILFNKTLSGTNFSFLENL
jgi:hypothetical protein